ncbi:MAG: M56 family metallopeptidase [Bacteroidota bacterium]
MPTPDFAPLLDLASAAVPVALPLVLKATVVFALGWGAARLVRGASAAWRHAVWAGTLAAVLAVTLLPLALPAWEVTVPVLPGETAAVTEGATLTDAATAPTLTAAEPSAFEAGAFDGFVAAEGTEASAVAAPTPWALMTAQPWAAVVLVWALGVLLVGAWWLVSALAAWRLAAQATPVKDGAWLALLADVADDLDLSTPVRLLTSDRLSVPVTWGAIGPVLILPGGADGWDNDRRRAVLAHELAHVGRRDVLWQWVAQFACALHWYQPLAWLAYRRLLAEREHACDDSVLRVGTRPTAYADVLLDVARAVQRREPVAALAMAPMARRSQLEGRLLSILDPSLDRRGLSRVLLAVLGAVTLLLAASLATVRPVAYAAADEAPFSFAEVASEEGVEVVAEREAGARDLRPDPQPRSQPRAMVAGATSYSADDFSWTGTLAPGKRLIVKNVNGEVKADGGTSNQVVIEATEDNYRGRRPTPAEVEVVEFSDGVVVCVRYEGQRGDCSPTESPSGSINNGVTVNFEVRVPRGVHFEGTSVNGAVEALGLSGDVKATSVNGAVKATTSNGNIEATSVNGAVEASASGTVRASSVNGAIRADMGRADWTGTAEYNSVNGAIILTLPSDFSAEVEAETMNGDIRSDFPLEIKRGRYVGVSASGTVGNGGRRMKLTTQNGSIQLRRSGAHLRGRGDRQERQDSRQDRRSATNDDRAALQGAHHIRDARLRAAVADTLRAAHQLAQAASFSLSDADDDLDVRIDEHGFRLFVNGQVEVDLDWNDLADEVESVVEDAVESVDWDGIADDLEAAFEDMDVDVHLNFGHAFPSAFTLDRPFAYEQAHDPC